ncbi:uncharacterized protein BO96DRAFT_440201 [Aspergillus niger CBS 101883]|uniref:uncharacterized protein n=1 Tax=Aspergillus lacticoffeatus (strain CBS 101883) TaxID=1450533 RepID=UPI000D8022B8|nr:uncharacterized protein BO96DRAFT_440201 [Aspergillus niger CBS 101883]PYH50135.1 hypothetical protein BO96DRAFT_440201 [Aspergillus niger CBS 101883]
MISVVARYIYVSVWTMSFGAAALLALRHIYLWPVALSIAGPANISLLHYSCATEALKPFQLIRPISATPKQRVFSKATIGSLDFATDKRKETVIANIERQGQLDESTVVPLVYIADACRPAAGTCDSHQLRLLSLAFICPFHILFKASPMEDVPAENCHQAIYMAFKAEYAVVDLFVSSRLLSLVASVVVRPSRAPEGAVEWAATIDNVTVSECRLPEESFPFPFFETRMVPSLGEMRTAQWCQLFRKTFRAAQCLRKLGAEIFYSRLYLNVRLFMPYSWINGSEQ